MTIWGPQVPWRKYKRFSRTSDSTLLVVPPSTPVGPSQAFNSVEPDSVELMSWTQYGLSTDFKISLSFTE